MRLPHRCRNRRLGRLLAKEKEQIRARLEKERTAAREVQRRAMAARQEAVEGGRVLPVQLGIRDAFAGGARRHVRVEVPEVEVARARVRAQARARYCAERLAQVRSAGSFLPLFEQPPQPSTS